MAKFRSPKEMATYSKAYGLISSSHKAILVDPNGKTKFEAPADQVQHYLDKGFKWSKS